MQPLLGPVTSVRDVPTRLLDAAERLVALRGDSGASSRAITIEAGQRHNSAIAYHFGNRSGLMDAVFTRGSRQVNDRRKELLAGRADESFSLAELVDIYIGPFALHLDEGTPSYWARFNEEALRGYPMDILPMLRVLLGRHGGVPLDTLLGVLEAMTGPTAGGGTLVSSHRVSGMVRYVIGTFAAWERDAETGTAATTASELGEELVVTALGLLTAPRPDGPGTLD